MIRDEKTGKFRAETEQEKLERQIAELQAKLAEAKKAEQEAKLAERKKAEEEKSLVRKADLEKVQAAANLYLDTVRKNKETRKALHDAEAKIYAAYREELEKFSKTHKGYHLTYIVDGDNVEFKIEEAHADSFAEQLEEYNKQVRNFWNGFFGD